MAGYHYTNTRDSIDPVLHISNISSHESQAEQLRPVQIRVHEAQAGHLCGGGAGAGGTGWPDFTPGCLTLKIMISSFQEKSYLWIK